MTVGRWKAFALAVLAAGAAAMMLWGPRPEARETVLNAFAQANFAGGSCHIYREGYLDDNHYKAEEKAAFLKCLGETIMGQEKAGDAEEKGGGCAGAENAVVYEQSTEDGTKTLRLTFLTEETEEDGTESRNNYLRAEIFLSREPDAGEALKEQERLREATGAAGLEDEVVIEISGYYEGKMSREEQRIAAETLFDRMKAVRRDEIDEEELYTVYGYSSDGGEARSVAGVPVNVNLAVTYDEKLDRTVFRLGCPMIGTEY